MTNLANVTSTQILLLAPDLLGESLALQLTSSDQDLEVMLRSEQLTRHPVLVIWSVESLESPSNVQVELQRLQEHWQPAPLLLLLPAQLRLNANELLNLDCPGLLQNPDLETLREAIKTLIGGGRVVKLQEAQKSQSSNIQTMGFGQWLLVSGLQQINNDLQRVEALLNPPPEHDLILLIFEGRRRELLAAQKLLLWLWGPLQMGLDAAVPLSTTTTSRISTTKQNGTSITLRERNAVAVWAAIFERLGEAVDGGLTNATGSLLAIEGLNPDRRRDLLLALLNQLNQVMQRLRQVNSSDNPLPDSWLALQPELRKQAIRTMAGSYVRLPLKGELKAVADQLLVNADLKQIDEELPDPQRMLAPLLLDQPVLVEGQLLPADDPRALLQLEIMVSNWLVRTAELISAEVLGACGEWPELRRYLLNPRLISTRELERLRNQLNSQARWQIWVQRPIQLYESQRLLYRVQQGNIEPLLLTEPRDDELRQLGWLQQQVALLLEARDALAPQVQALLKRIGDLMVVVLTQVLGRAIGLVGRGIVQGMGRSLGRS
ncbi:MAG: DUF3685 domain-containing protein [Prochlorococcus sp.]|nr:DUF3685 domain-containing protein [Prochlorococcus sp.]MDP6192957.1 DUF3685 domain-containing protein [Prochlorococcaceae cyanobacterium ETNP18_MAG_1]